MCGHHVPITRVVSASHSWLPTVCSLSFWRILHTALENTCANHKVQSDCYIASWFFITKSCLKQWYTNIFGRKKWCFRQRKNLPEQRRLISGSQMRRFDSVSIYSVHTTWISYYMSTGKYVSNVDAFHLDQKWMCEICLVEISRGTNIELDIWLV